MWKPRITNPLGLTLPSDIFPTNVRHVADGNLTVNGSIVYWYELRYTACGRQKRCFMAHAPIGSNTKPYLAVALPGSNSNADANGARDLIVPPAGDTQYQWPLQLCLQYGVFAVMIDLPKFGFNPYDPTNPIDPLVDTICGVMAARWFIEETAAFRSSLYRPMFVGGWSWGAIIAEYLAAAIPNITHAYIGCGQMSKQYDARPMFNPPEWVTSDYSDMFKAASANYRFQFGGNGQDYLYQPFKSPFVPDVDSILNDLVSTSPTRFSYTINPALGHNIDVTNLKSWFNQQFLGSTTWYVDPTPEY